MNGRYVLIVDYNLTPQLVLSFKDTLRASQLPELENEGYRVREDDDNYSNTALATLASMSRSRAGSLTTLPVRTFLKFLST